MSVGVAMNTGNTEQNLPTNKNLVSLARFEFYCQKVLKQPCLGENFISKLVTKFPFTYDDSKENKERFFSSGDKFLRLGFTIFRNISFWIYF